MGFRIGYVKLLTLRCWHPDFLGLVAGAVPIAPGTPLTIAERKDYLNYDLRALVDLAPTEAGAATLARYGLIWTPSTLGGWLLARDSYVETDPAVRLQLALHLRSPQFASATDFGVASLEGQLFHLTNANTAVAPEVDLTGGNLRAVHYVPSQGFTVRLPQLVPGTDSQVQLRDPLLSGNPILRTFDVAGGEPTTDHYELDLGDFPAGLYRFIGGNITTQNMSVGFATRPGLLGTIDLRLADWAGSAFDLHFQPSNP